MTKIVAEELWARVQAVFVAYADELFSVGPKVIRDMGHTANDSFLFRGYLTFKKCANGDELAITIDVQSDDYQITIESGAYTDDGKVVAIGPSASIPLCENQLELEGTLNDWVGEFVQFLKENKEAVLAVISQLDIPSS